MFSIMFVHHSVHRGKSVPMGPLPMMHWISLYRVPLAAGYQTSGRPHGPGPLPPPPKVQTWSSQAWSQLPQTSNMGPPPTTGTWWSSLDHHLMATLKHVRLTSGQYTSYWNSFLFRFSFNFKPQHKQLSHFDSRHKPLSFTNQTYSHCWHVILMNRLDLGMILIDWGKLTLFLLFLLTKSGIAS